MSVKFYGGTHPENARCLMVLAAAELAGISCTTAKGFVPYVDNEKDAFLLNCHPLGRLPVIETEDGYLFESNSILRYFARVNKKGTNLYGSTTYERSLVDAWLDFANGEINVSNKYFIVTYFRKTPTSDAEEKQCIANVEEVLTGLNNWLETRTFIVGERLTIADLALAFALQWVYRCPPHAVAENFAKKFKNCWRLYNTVMSQPEIITVLKIYNATFGIPLKPKEEKRVVKKEEKKPKQVEEDDEDTPIEEKKKPNPLDSLPPSKMVLDAFKREYSNNDTRTKAAPWFFDNFDPEGYSCYWANYKFNNENKKQFMTANLIRGWFQRMEGCRKYCFGVALIIGTDSEHEITTFWVIRGKGIPECVKDVEDTEIFEWIEIKDINAEKEKITDYLCWEGPTIPKLVLEGRVFK